MGVHPLKRAVFLDRDGVLNAVVLRAGNPHPPASVDEMEITPGAAADLARLKAAGFVLIVVTNQPDVARGTQTMAAVEAMNARLSAEMPLDDFIVCYHDSKDDCPCRKPKPGLLLLGAERHGVDLAASYMVGDRWRDVAAGQAAGCTTVFLDFQYAEGGPKFPADAKVKNLTEAVDWILDRYNTEVR